MLENWIIDYENYRIKNLIEDREIVRSTEAKIYSNIFISFDKEWNNWISTYKINNYRKLTKKIYNKGIEKNNINNDIVFLVAFIFISLGSLNIFSLLFNKILDFVFKEGGIRFNVLVMRLGEHLISNFHRQLIKEFKIESNNSARESLSSKKSLDFNWGVNPLELFVKLTSTSSLKRETNTENITKDSDDRENLLEMFQNISEELKAELGNSFMVILKSSSKELIIKEKREENKTYLFVTLDSELYPEIWNKSIKSVFLPMIVRPRLWTKKENGGYLSDIMNSYANPENQIVKSNPNIIENSKIYQKQIDCVNYMNNVPFNINITVLNYLLME